MLRQNLRMAEQQQYNSGQNRPALNMTGQHRRLQNLTDVLRQQEEEEDEVNSLRTNLRLSFPNQGVSRTVTGGDRPHNNSEFSGLACPVPTPNATTSHVATCTSCTTNSTTTSTSSMHIKPPVRHSHRPAPRPNMSLPIGSASNLHLDPGSSDSKHTTIKMQQNIHTNNNNNNNNDHHHHCSSQFLGNVIGNSNKSRSNNSYSNSTGSSSSRLGSSFRGHDAIAKDSLFSLEGGASPVNTENSEIGNVREKKKKLLVLHLPPSGPSNHHTAAPPTIHLHHHHHHRSLHHHEALRERTHKRLGNNIRTSSPEAEVVLYPSAQPRRERIPRGIGMYPSIQTSGKLKISPELQVEFTADDLRDLGEIGRGGFGTVNKMVHRKTNTIMAVKRIRSTVDEKEQKQLLMDLDVVMRSNECPCIVQFYGAIFKEGDCWICMELMDTSLDKFYKFIYERLEQRLPENMLGKVTVATLTALNYLKEKLKIIHRDVKPSNILLDRRGNIKLCDFGISGQLVDSIAKTRDAGCRPYMAPERIDPARARGYDVRSDVWSLGITLMELATGSFPYPKWNSVFEQLTQVVQGEPPRLSPNENGNTFTEAFVNFVNTCLIKDECSRPKYKQLLDHEFVVRSREDPMDLALYVGGIMDQMATNGRLMYTYDSYNY